MTDEKNKEEVNEYKVVQYPTEHVPAIQTPSKELMTTEQALAEILNRLDKVEKLLG